MEICPVGAIVRVQGVYTVFDKGRGCGNCVEKGGSGAIILQKDK